jgi:hypothetical protein
MEMMNRLTTVVLAFSTLVVFAACENDLDPGDPLGSIGGTLSYAGSEASELAYPGLSVTVFSRFPPNTAPHGNVILEINADDLPLDLDYQLDNIPGPWEYFVLGSLIDIGQPVITTGEGAVPIGAFPDLCKGLFTNPGPVAVTNGELTDGVDITIYDENGALDPCGSAPPSDSICPDPDRATMVVTVSNTTITAGPGDSLVYALFSSSPPAGPPLGFGSIPVADIEEFPYNFVKLDLFPSDYALLLCYDVGGDNQQCDGPGDVSILTAGVNTYASGQVVTTSANIDDASYTEPVSVPAPAECN